MLDVSVNWGRMSKGIQWPKMKLTYVDGSVECTDGTTYQYEHGLRKKGKRPVKIEVQEDVSNEMSSYLYTSLGYDGTLVDENGYNYDTSNI